MFSSNPADYLPHREPFLHIHRLTHLQPGCLATAEINVPTDGAYPPILLIEAMAQLGGIAAGQTGAKGGVLGAIESSRLPLAVAAGSKLAAKATVARSFGSFHVVDGEVHHDSRLIASARLTLVMQQ